MVVGAVGEHVHVDRRRQRRLQLRQQRLDAVDDLDDVGAGLALDVEDDRRRRRSSRRPGATFSAPSIDVGDVGEADRRAVAVGDDRAAGTRRSDSSWSLAPMV